MKAALAQVDEDLENRRHQSEVDRSRAVETSRMKAALSLAQEDMDDETHRMLDGKSWLLESIRTIKRGVRDEEPVTSSATSVQPEPRTLSTPFPTLPNHTSPPPLILTLKKNTLNIKFITRSFIISNKISKTIEESMSEALVVIVLYLFLSYFPVFHLLL